MIGSAELNNPAYEEINLNDARTRSWFIEWICKRTFETCSSDERQIVKDSLQYFLHTPDVRYGRLDRIFASAGLAMAPPSDRKGFFVEVWAALFPCETWQLDSLEGFQESDKLVNLHAPAIGDELPPASN